MKEYKTLDLGAITTKAFILKDDTQLPVPIIGRDGVNLVSGETYLIRSLVIPKRDTDIIEDIYIDPFFTINNNLFEVQSKDIEKKDGYTCVDLVIRPKRNFIIYYTSTSIIRYKLMYLVKDTEDIRYES